MNNEEEMYMYSCIVGLEMDILGLVASIYIYINERERERESEGGAWTDSIAHQIRFKVS